MKRGQKVAIAVLAVALIIVVAVLARPRQQEPLYQGKTLSQWLLICATSGSPGKVTAAESHEVELAEKAVRTIGTNAVPTLLALTDYRLPKWRMSLLRTYYRLVKRFGGTPYDIYNTIVGPAEVRADLAFAGFEILGPQARQAIPELVRRVNAGNGPAAVALAYIGPDALDPLLRALNDPKPATRRAAAGALGSCKDLGANTNAVISALALRLNDADQRVAIAATTSIGQLALAPEIGVPALAKNLGNRDSGLQTAAILAVGMYGSAARQVLPALHTNLSHRNEWVRFAATNAIMRIAPDADEPKQGK